MCPHSNYSLSEHSDPTLQRPSRPLVPRLGLDFRVGVVAAVSRSRKRYHHRAKKMPHSLATKPYFLETASLFVRARLTSEEVRLRGQIYSSWKCSPSTTATWYIPPYFFLHQVMIRLFISIINITNFLVAYGSNTTYHCNNFLTRISSNFSPEKAVAVLTFFRAFFGSIPEDFGNRGESGKIPVAIPRFLRREKKTKQNNVIRFAVVWSYLCFFWHCLVLIVNFVMVDSPRFPKSSGIDPKKAALKIP